MTKNQVLTKLNERLAKRNFKATIYHFDSTLQSCEIVITDQHNYIIAVMNVSFDNETLNVFQGTLCSLPNQFADAFNLIEKGEY